MKLITTNERYLGCLLGLACGDAVGTTLEFKRPGTFEPITDMVGGGPFNLKLGHWTDDTSMALCMAKSLIERRSFDAKDQMNRYVKWWKEGYLSPTGRCFDMGTTVRTALESYVRSGEPFSGPERSDTAGNGSLMRLAPAILFAHPSVEKIIELSIMSSRTTHGAAEVLDCCHLFGMLIHRALSGKTKGEILAAKDVLIHEKKVVQIARGAYFDKTCSEIKGTGYAVNSLEAALWCFYTTENFKDAVLAAANLGNDADTTAAIVGQIAGAFYGVQGIPEHWIKQLYMSAELGQMAIELLNLAEGKQNS